MVTTKQVGLGIMIAAAIMFIVGFYYVRAAEQALFAGHEIGSEGGCTHAEGAVCPYEQLNKLAVPKYVGLFADIALFIFGLSLFLKRTPEEKAVSKAKKEAKKLGGDEGKAYDLITQSNGMIFQNELAEKLGVSKVKITRILDKLEAKGLVERRRRGMTNVIILR
jgi:uncharacterized membrane protein